MMLKRKNISKTLKLLFGSFFLGFLIGVLGKNAYENSTIKPYGWKSLPIVVNCYGPDFSEAQFVRAIDYWAIRGYQIGFYEHNPPEGMCDHQDWMYGFIIIRKASRFQLYPDTLASTKRYTSLTVIKGAQIYYRAGSQNLTLINEHELGHALGFVHVEKEGHVMHPLFHKMGDKFYLEKD